MIPVLGRSPGEGNGNPLQNSCLGSSMEGSLAGYSPWDHKESDMTERLCPVSMGFSRQEYWSGLPFLSPGDLPDPGIKPGSPALEADALTSEPPGKPIYLKCTSFDQFFAKRFPRMELG